ncbi:MAG: 4Fe-4S cluster-binding domain-containing protein [Eubacteriales bacterium]
MNIAHIDYSLKMKSLDVYVSGCNAPHCEGCHNPELWDFKVGEKVIDKWLEVEKYFDNFSELIDNVMIFGGEPLDQNPKKLDWLLFLLDCRRVEFGDKFKIWLFTKYEFKDIPIYIKKYCDYIKCGKFVKELKTDNNVQFGVKLATSNQKIYRRGYDF